MIESDRLILWDKRTMVIIKCMGNDIHPSIQLEVDCPSNYDDGKLPMLDLKVWIALIDGFNRIEHSFTPSICCLELWYILNQCFNGSRREPYLSRKYYVLCLTDQKIYHGRWSSMLVIVFTASSHPIFRVLDAFFKSVVKQMKEWLESRTLWSLQASIHLGEGGYIPCPQKAKCFGTGYLPWKWLIKI